jgi:hypothetical protein
MSMSLQFRCIWTQQARSEGVIWLSGNVQAMAGTSDQTISSTSAPSWRERFTAVSAYSTAPARFTFERAFSLDDKNRNRNKSRSLIGPAEVPQRIQSEPKQRDRGKIRASR